MIIRRHAAEPEPETPGSPLEEALKPRGCLCGRTFADLASYTVHRDPSRGCLDGDAFGQLTEVDGVWCRI